MSNKIEFTKIAAALDKETTLLTPLEMMIQQAQAQNLAVIPCIVYTMIFNGHYHYNLRGK